MPFPDKPVAHLLGSGGPVHALAYSASPGTYVLAGSSDRSVRLYNPQPSAANHHPSSSHLSKKGVSPVIPEGRLIQTYSAHGYEVLSLSVSPTRALCVRGR
ncbi:hypothetical protein NUW58_g7307 [Xylaria curta]|uniref:Uncharacterized protein n=1 Tax=Xylaria curta TaxID=42375 RepID=A0ACC1NIA2_9PEZI|nr:hypothetical protein NUW58_g7307 [Xylaria curta]